MYIYIKPKKKDLLNENIKIEVNSFTDCIADYQENLIKLFVNP